MHCERNPLILVLLPIGMSSDSHCFSVAHAGRTVEQLQMGFRFVPNVSEITQAQQSETQAYRTKQDFLADERDGIVTQLCPWRQ